MNIFQAVRQGEIERIRRWIVNGGDIPIREDEDGYSLVMAAVAEGHLQLADELRQQGAVFTAKDATEILSELCDDDDGTLTRYVLAAGANPNGLDSLGRPLLISAAWLGSTEMVPALLAAGGSPEVREGAWPPLIQAAHYTRVCRSSKNVG